MTRPQGPPTAPAARPTSAAGSELAASGVRFDVAAFLVGAAVHAPSVHNSQPWRFVYLDDGSLELHADPRRALHAIDPAGRELAISCGAALATLKLGVRWLGYRPVVRRCPDPTRPGLLAHLALGRSHQASPLELDLFAAVLDRHTHRGPFSSRPVPRSLLASLGRLARRSSCHAALLGARQLAQVARWDAAARTIQYQQPATRAELGAAVRAAGDPDRDGVVIRPTADGPAGRPGSGRPGPHRRNPGQLGARWEPPSADESGDVPTNLSTDAPTDLPSYVPIEPVPGSAPGVGGTAPATVLLSTRRDTPVQWLWAGEAMQYLLLRAAQHGVYASAHTQLLEVASTRVELARLAGIGCPQMLLQLGYADSSATAPRRPPGLVLTTG